MGLSIHYSGNIRNYSFVEELTNEVQDICQSLNWNHYIWKNDEPLQNVKGISFSPENCEPVFLTFLQDGKLISPIKLMLDKDFDGDLMPFMIHTKTQYAGEDAHIALLKLLRYIKHKYFDTLELIDEGMYWETGDEKILHSQFEKYEETINIVTSTLSGMKAIPGESIDSLSERIEKLLKSG